MKGERKEAWMRILVAIVTGIILSIWKTLIGLFAVLNWLIVMFSGRRSADLANFSEYFNTELYKYSKYLTFVTNKRPFPFSKIEKIGTFGK